MVTLPNAIKTFDAKNYISLFSPSFSMKFER